MNDVLNRVASVLERRFMLVLLLPMLIFVSALVLLVTVTAGRWRAAVSGWGALPGSLQFVFILGYLATIWLLAGFLDSQLRNITQLFEGYQLTNVMAGIAGRAQAWHRRKRRELTGATIRTASPGGPEGDASVAQPPAARPGFAEQLFVLYPAASAVMPTRLGNVIRAAEDYSQSRYGANYLLVWPRLAHLCTERFVQDYEISRAGVDFLLVVSTLSALFAVLGGLVVVILNGAILLFVAVILGGFGLSRLAYASAVDAAKEYGEQIRASVDLFRLELLRQLRYPEPADPKRERAMWEDFDDLLRRGEQRRYRYASAPEPPPIPGSSGPRVP
ncbi:MAG: hypothetical protein ACJ72N_07945 [Labedaea sp.]